MSLNSLKQRLEMISRHAFKLTFKERLRLGPKQVGREISHQCGTRDRALQVSVTVIRSWNHGAYCLQRHSKVIVYKWTVSRNSGSQEAREIFKTFKSTANPATQAPGTIPRNPIWQNEKFKVAFGDPERPQRWVLQRRGQSGSATEALWAAFNLFLQI